MQKLLAELKRRQMFRVAAAYAVVAWLILQVVNNVAPGLNLPNWVVASVIVLLAVGFPVALLFCWIQHLAPAGDAAAQVKTNRLDWILAGGLAAVIALILFQQLAPLQTTRSAQQADLAPGAAQAGPGGISIAVLPFANMSGDAGQEFFSDGITEEINGALAKVPNLQVVARTSVFQFKGQNRDIEAIGQQLHATHLIEGSVRKAGDQVRITAQLFRADNGLQLWSETYDRQLTNIFAIQEDIAQAIAGALRVPLGLRQGETLVSNRTDDVDSYQDYLRGRVLVRARAVDEAIAVLERAVARDPEYAPAWAMLSQAYRAALDYDAAPRSAPVDEARRFVQSNLDKADMAARKAMELDPRHAGGYAALAYVQATRGKWTEAEDLFRHALQLDQNDPESLNRYGFTLARAGRLAEGFRVNERMRALEPFVPIYNIVAAVIMRQTGQTEASIALLESVPANSPARYFRNVYLAQAYAAAGRFADAADTLLAIRGEPQVSAESVEAAARLIRTPTVVSAPASLPVLQGELGFVYAYVGARERALEFQERRLQIGHFATGEGLWAPEVAPLRKTERFRALIRNYGFVDYWRARGWPDFCRPLGADDFVCD